MVDDLLTPSIALALKREVIVCLDRVYVFHAGDQCIKPSTRALHSPVKEALKWVRNFDLQDRTPLARLLAKAGTYDLVGRGLPTEALALLDRAVQVASAEVTPLSRPLPAGVRIVEHSCRAWLKEGSWRLMSAAEG